MTETRARKKDRPHTEVWFGQQNARTTLWWKLIIPVMSRGKIMLLRRLLAEVFPCRSPRPAVEGPKYVVGQPGQGSHLALTYLTPLAVGVLKKIVEDYQVSFEESAKRQQREAEEREVAAAAENRSVLFPRMGDRHPLADELHEYLSRIDTCAPCTNLKDPSSIEEGSHMLFQLGEICRSHSINTDLPP